MRDTRYDVWEFGGRSRCQGAVQEIELVPKTEVGADPKLNRGGRPPTGQLGEALCFRCRFRRQFQSSAMKVPFSEPGLREGDFRFPATKVPFSEVSFRSGERGTQIRTNRGLGSSQDTCEGARRAHPRQVGVDSRWPRFGQHVRPRVSRHRSLSSKVV